MSILFDIGHPAHVHLFKNFIHYLIQRNCGVVITSRDKEITNSLLDYYELPYSTLTRQKPGKANMFLELLERDLKIYRLHLKNQFKIAIGTSVSIGHLSLMTNVKSYNFNEDDDEIVPLFSKIAYPFSTKIVNPDCLASSTWTSKRVVHNSYHELAYLHPNNFTPDVSVLNKYHLEPAKYIIARFSSLEAHHDVGVQGISNALWSKIEKEIEGYPVIRSIEKNNTHQINPWDMHHVLAFAGLVISDSQTMTAEAAVLGVPSVRINSFARRIGYLKELEFKYGLTKSFLPNEEKDILAHISGLVRDKFQLAIFQERRAHMLSEKVDFNQWIIDFFDQELKGI